MVVEIGRDTGRKDTCLNCWKPIHEVQWGAHVLTWHHESGDVTCEAAPVAEPVSGCSCGGTGWVDDEGWQPEFHNRQRRTEGDGLIPCGFCNHGGERVDHA